MNIRLRATLSIILFCLGSCGRSEPTNTLVSVENAQALIGTWKLISNEIITNGQTEKVFPIEGQEMIKIFNATSFAFFKHDIHKGKGEDAIFESGSGSYTLAGTVYKEKLLYCNYRDWEDHEFTFQLTLKQDTIIQRGIEKIDSLHVNREIVETYVRLHHQ